MYSFSSLCVCVPVFRSTLSQLARVHVSECECVFVSEVPSTCVIIVYFFILFVYIIVGIVVSLLAFLLMVRHRLTLTHSFNTVNTCILCVCLCIPWAVCMCMYMYGLYVRFDVSVCVHVVIRIESLIIAIIP